MFLTFSACLLLTKMLSLLVGPLPFGVRGCPKSELLSQVTQASFSSQKYLVRVLSLLLIGLREASLSLCHFWIPLVLFEFGDVTRFAPLSDSYTAVVGSHYLTGGKCDGLW